MRQQLGGHLFEQDAALADALYQRGDLVVVVMQGYRSALPPY
jgi:hypothetical protein